MNRYLIACFSLAVVIGIIDTGCTKPSPFGSELLESELSEYDTLTLPVNCTVQFEDDSLVTSDRKGDVSFFLCGAVDDKIFGYFSSEIYTQILPFSNPVNFNNTTLDSIVMILPYAPAGFYGDTSNMQTLRVYKLRDTFESRNYYSTETIAEEVEIGRVDNFIPRPYTKYKGLDTTSAATNRFAHLRVKLDNSFGDFIRSIDSTTMANEVTLNRIIKGLKITSSPTGGQGAMMAFDLNGDKSMIRMYYHVGTDTIQKVFNISASSGTAHKFSHFQLAKSGTIAANAVGVPNPKYLFVHGLGHMRVRVEFPTAPQLDNIIINNAILEMTPVTLPEDMPVLPFATQLVASDSSTSSFMRYVNDLRYSLDVRNTYGFFGGQPTDDVYRMALTQRFQDIVDDTTGDPSKRTVYVSVGPAFSLLRLPYSTIDPFKLLSERVVLHGSSTDTPYELRAKVKLKFTKL